MITCPDCGLTLTPFAAHCTNCFGILEWDSQDSVSVVGYDFNLSDNRPSSVSLLERPVFSCFSLDMTKWRLQIVFRSKKCRFACHFCDIRNNGLSVMPSSDNIVAQLVYTLQRHAGQLPQVQVASLGAEGTIWDKANFPAAALACIMESLRQAVPHALVKLEGRADLLQHLDTKFFLALLPGQFGIKTSLETLDADVRNRILGKHLSTQTFESNVSRILAEGVNLTVFIMVKPSPFMDDSAALDEAKKTCDFIMALGDRWKMQVKIRATAMYVAKGTKWAEKAAAVGVFKAPTISVMARLGKHVRERGHLISLRLWEENSCMLNNTFWNRLDATLAAFNTVLRFNQSQEAVLLDDIISGKTGEDPRPGEEKLRLINPHSMKAENSVIP